MSRNFELLNQMGKGPVMLQPEVEPVKTHTTEEAASFTAPLEIESMARAEISKLVHRLFLLSGAESPRRVVFTSTEPGNGTSWMCARAAEVLASQVNRSVCIVDCNLKTPTLHTQFGVENHHGLADALTGDGTMQNYVRQLRRNLWLVSCGAASERAQDLLTSDRMRVRVAELANEFDYVLLDVAPMNNSNNAVVLGNAVDGVVLVLKANSSRRDSTRQSIQTLHASNVKVLGAILNQRTFPIPDHIYHRL